MLSQGSPASAGTAPPATMRRGVTEAGRPPGRDQPGLADPAPLGRGGRPGGDDRRGLASAPRSPAARAARRPRPGALRQQPAAGAVRRPAAFPRAWCGAALTLDTLLLTGLLHATGGASNPFSVLYLVYITLAAVVLGARWTWFLAALSVGCYGLLFATHLPLEHACHLAPEMQLHLQGMWVAFCVAAVLTAYFVVQMSTAIERRDAEMSAMRDRAARSERLASLTTLAAGAAHELGTPLATIAVAARELERSIRALPGAQAAALVEDATLIRSEVDRCRAILNRLGAQVGQTPGEAPRRDRPRGAARGRRALRPGAGAGPARDLGPGGRRRERAPQRRPSDRREPAAECARRRRGHGRA